MKTPPGRLSRTLPSIQFPKSGFSQKTWSKRFGQDLLAPKPLTVSINPPTTPLLRWVGGRCRAPARPWQALLDPNREAPNPSRTRVGASGHGLGPSKPKIVKSMTGPFVPERTPNAKPKLRNPICFMVLAPIGYRLWPSNPKIGKSMTGPFGPERTPPRKTYVAKSNFHGVSFGLARFWLAVSSVWVALGWACLHTTALSLPMSTP